MASEGPNNDDERGGRAAAELKETEELLAGFNRPGRTPRVPPVTRDFVDYHLEKRRSNPAARSPSAAAPGRARPDLPTAILAIPGQKPILPRWLPWAGLLLLMALGGVVVAALGSGESNEVQQHVSDSLPSAATNIASGSPILDPTTGPERDIPPPPPAELTPHAASSEEPMPVMTDTPPSARPSPSIVDRSRSPAVSAGAAGSAAPPPAATPARSATIAPDVDLIRNL